MRCLMLPIAAAVALLAVQSAAHAQVQLGWKLQAGAKFYQETTASLKQTIRIKGQETKQDLQYTTVTSFAVLQKSNDGIVLEQKVESVTPSAAIANTQLGALIQEMKGATFKITLSPEMQIKSFEGYEELIRNLAKDDPAAQKVLQSMLSKETLQKSAEEAFAFVKRDPVKPGDHWERKLTMALGPIGSVTGTYQYTYVGPETVDGKPLQKIAVDTALTYTPSRSDQAAFPFQIVRGDLKVEDGKGTIWFDAGAGRMAGSEMQMRIKGTLVISAMGQEHTLELDQDQTVKIKITDQPPK